MATSQDIFSGTYKTACGWAIFLYVFTIGISIGAFFMFREAWVGESFGWFIGGLLVVCLIIYLIVELQVSRLTIKGNQITRRYTYSYREITLEELAGYRTTENGFYLIPKDSKLKSIEISKTYEKKHEWAYFIVANLPNLDVEEVRQEEEEIRENTNFGKTQEERDTTIKKARRISKVINTLAFVLPMWFLLYPKPYHLLAVGCLLLPIVVVILVVTGKGLFLLNLGDDGPYPALGSGTFLPPMIVIARTIIDVNMLSIHSIWWFLLPLASIGTYVVFKWISVNPLSALNSLEKTLLIPITFCCVTLYFLSATFYLNVRLDNSLPIAYELNVEERYIEDPDYGNIYYVVVPPFGSQPEEENMKVSKTLYDKVKEGEIVYVFEKPGFLGIPWVYVRLK